MSALHRHVGTTPMPWPVMVLGTAIVASLPLTLLAGCSVQTPVVATATSPPAIVAESTVTCFGVTARLALVRVESGAVVTPSATVRGLRWHLDVDVPPDMLATEEVWVSLDTFTIRGDQAVREDLVALRSSGQAWPLSTEGVVHMPALPGGIREGDHGRILAWLQTPRGTFGVRGIEFDLASNLAGLDASSPSVVPDKACPAP